MHDVLSSRSLDHVRVFVIGSPDPIFHDLRDGESALVGRAAGCQLHIDDDSLPPHQCLVELRDGALWLHNWSEQEKITVNNQVVDEEIVLSQDDVVEFGIYRIVFELPDASPMSPSQTPTEQRPQQPRETEELTVDNATSAEGLQVPMLSGQPPAIQRKPESAETSTIELLKSEIEFLQRELEERNTELEERNTELADLTSTTPMAEATSARSCVPPNRLTDLLIELELSDDRISNLEHEVRAVDELLAAELEEKHQIESWVNDIEIRLAKREDENAAELELLRGRLEREKSERLITQQQADDNLRGGANSTQLHDTLKMLRHDYEALRNEYNQTVVQCQELEKELKAAREENEGSAMQERVEQALRLERLQISQERATLSRREHEFASKLRELETQLENQNRLSAVDERFQVFRERLKELHVEEQSEYQPPSIGQRLLKLWHSLDGPTDKD